MLYHMGRTSRAALRTGGKVYGGFIYICLYIAFVLPCLMIVWMAKLAIALVRAIAAGVNEYRAECERQARPAAQRPQSYYSNRR